MLVNINQRSNDDWNTVSSMWKMYHMASMFNGKFIAVPIAVSVNASTHASFFVCTYTIISCDVQNFKQFV